MITRALILAAGQGVRIGDAGVPNCLARVGRTSLLERTLALLDGLGIQKIGIVIGYGGDRIQRHLAAADLPAVLKGRITFFENADWSGPNGLSVLAARAFVTERTLLVMADQIAAPSLVREMVTLPSAHGPTVLAVDRDLARVFDIDDATK